MRNQRIDLLKCAAIFSVVFLHIKSGLWDWPVTCLTRFAVPCFFLIAGYYAYGQGEGKLLRRAWHTFLLWLAGVGVAAALWAGMILRHPGWSLWPAFWDQIRLGSWLKLLVYQEVPFAYSYHLWFIGSMPLLYLAWRRRPLSCWQSTCFCRRGLPYWDGRSRRPNICATPGWTACPSFYWGRGCTETRRKSYPP